MYEHKIDAFALSIVRVLIQMSSYITIAQVTVKYKGDKTPVATEQWV